MKFLHKLLVNVLLGVSLYGIATVGIWFIANPSYKLTALQGMTQTAITMCNHKRMYKWVCDSLVIIYGEDE